MYSQIVDGIVSLIGDESVGLPLSKQTLEQYSNVQCIDISEITPIPQVGDYYINGEFLTIEEYIEKYPLGTEMKSISKPTDGELAIMEALATQYEEGAEKDLVNMEVQATIFEKLLEIEERGNI